MESLCHSFFRRPLLLRVCDRLPLSPCHLIILYSLDFYPCSSSREIAPCMTVCLVPNLILSSFTPAFTNARYVI